MREPGVVTGRYGPHVMLCRETTIDWRAHAGGAVVVRLGCVDVSGWPEELEALGRALLEIGQAGGIAIRRNAGNAYTRSEIVHQSIVVATPEGPLEPVMLTSRLLQLDDRCHDCGGPILDGEGVFCRACVANRPTEPAVHYEPAAVFSRIMATVGQRPGAA